MPIPLRPLPLLLALALVAPAQPAPAQPAAAPAEAMPPVPDVSGMDVRIFTPGGRALDMIDSLVGIALGTTAKSLEQGVGESNKDANIKLARDKATLGRSLEAYLESAYERDFVVRLEFALGDDDVFINLGATDPPGWAEEWSLDGLSLDDEIAAPASASAAASIPAGDSGPVAAIDTSDLPDFTGIDVTIFTPASRAFDARDTALVAALRSRGASVFGSPGGGGSNEKANVKVAKDRKHFGRRLEAVLERTYGWDFETLPEWDEGSRDVFVNLGVSVTRLCGPDVSLNKGSQVLRGPDWKWENQDGGPGRLGTIIEPEDEEGWVTVKWENGTTNSYRWGAEWSYDLIRAD